MSRLATHPTLAIDGGTPVRTRPFGGWPVFGREEEEALLAALRSGTWGSLDGTFVKRLEQEFAAFHGARYGVSCVNGTMALSVALKALGVGPGDEVLVPPYTFIATASAALMIGAIPVFVDVDGETLLMDPALIDAAVSPRTRAIILVHHAGSPADMDGVMAAARRHDLRVVEDAAQAHGAAWRGHPVGAIGGRGYVQLPVVEGDQRRRGRHDGDQRPGARRAAVVVPERRASARRGVV